MRTLEIRRHTMRAKPAEILTPEGIALARRVGAELGRFDRVITSTRGRAFETALAMGYPQAELMDGLSTLGNAVDAEISWDAGFGAFAEVIRRGGVTREFARGQEMLWRSIIETVPDGANALVITHGGIIEAGTVAAVPDWDHASLGPHCDYCEGVRLHYEGPRFTSVEVLRVDRS